MSRYTTIRESLITAGWRCTGRTRTRSTCSVCGHWAVLWHYRRFTGARASLSRGKIVVKGCPECNRADVIIQQLSFDADEPPM